ncbi:PAP2 superfamily-domain-containing protein [Chytridium lagenaria]|nr:PAP2 superfamily-domain-containing protein [Chytridium lagenaria]
MSAIKIIIEENGDARGAGGHSKGPDRRQHPLILFFREMSTIVISITAVTIIYTRSFTAVYGGAGAVLCSLTAKALKKLIKQPRPTSPPRIINSSVAKKYMAKVTSGQESSPYGMPSSHSAALAFFGSFLSYHFMDTSSPWTASWINPARIAAALAVNGFATSVGWSRVRMGHHTWIQVVAGLCLGFSFGGVWGLMQGTTRELLMPFLHHVLRPV